MDYRDFIGLQAFMQPGTDDLLELLTERPRWHADAACRGQGTAAWFPKLGDSTEQAKSICGGCPVRVECAGVAVGDPGMVGIWGGLSNRERARLRNRHTAA